MTYVGDATALKPRIYTAKVSEHPHGLNTCNFMKSNREV